MLQMKSDERKAITFTLNGKKVTGHAEPRMLLADFLRDEMGLREIHVGCEHGVCGACTIRINGKVARSCLTFAAQVDGADVKTVQSLAPDGELSALQKAFRKHHALQCGYCTPGILMSTSAFLETNPKPSEEEIRLMLSGHICRCTGYVGMVEAIKEVTGSPSDKEVGEPVA